MGDDGYWPLVNVVQVLGAEARELLFAETVWNTCDVRNEPFFPELSRRNTLSDPFADPLRLRVAQQFLAGKVSLPSLSDQRAAVLRVDTLSKRISEVRLIQQEVSIGQLQVLTSYFGRLVKGARMHRMRDIAPLVRRPITIEPNTEYPELGIRSFGRGTFHKPAIRGADVGTKRLFEIHPDDLVFSNVFAWEGAVAVASDIDAGRCGSHRFITCVPPQGIATAKFLRFYFLTPGGLDKLRRASPGGAGRNRTLGLGALDEIEVPVPHFDDQVHFDALQDKVGIIAHIRDRAAQELEALLPCVLNGGSLGLEDWS